MIRRMFDSCARATATDVVGSAFDVAPALVPDDTPHDLLLDAAKECGVKVLDLRTMDRRKHYPPREACVQNGHDFGNWGWYRDGDDIKDKKNDPLRAKPRGTIPWPSLTGVLLHTTDVDMSAPRFLGTPVQTGIAKDGTIVLCHPINAKLWHAHAANKFTCGVEVSGNKGAILPVQVEPLRALIRYIHAERQRHHAGDMVIMGHCQSHKSRKNDPGRDIWQAGGEWAIREMGLKLGPVVGSGRAVPAAWRAA